jgi:class 3 adenylate cyclase
MVEDRLVRVKRRLSAILAADVAGYSRLMHHDEEATFVKLTVLLADGVAPAITENGGRIVKNTGDGFLAVFPSAVQAVRAAVRFQTRIKELTIADAEDMRIAFRVGINVGDMIVEPHDVFGHCVNIAARLESIAEPGGICISSSAYVQTRGKVGIEFADLGEQPSKTSAARFEPMPRSWIEIARRHKLSTQGEASFHRLISPSLCCRSPISAAIPNRITSSMASLRPLRRTCRASTARS